jgi:hypothetical protein
VLEAESQSAAELATAAIPSAAVTVPATLHASLMARLDRLGPAKEVAQIGAAIGREFSAVVRTSEKELDSALSQLIAAGLLFRQGAPPYGSYLFKHALVQEAAYGTLLREPRRALHARIAGTLETPIMIGHRLLANTLLCMGDSVTGCSPARLRLRWSNDRSVMNLLHPQGEPSRSRQL